MGMASLHTATSNQLSGQILEASADQLQALTNLMMPVDFGFSASGTCTGK
jgi:hypothetical protein